MNPPTFVNKAEVQVQYSARVGLLDARSEVTVAIEGGLLFYKRRGRMDFRYSDYSCPESMPPPAEQRVAEPRGTTPGAYVCPPGRPGPLSVPAVSAVRPLTIRLSTPGPGLHPGRMNPDAG